LLNSRTDPLRRGSFKTMLANSRCVIPAEGFLRMVGRTRQGAALGRERRVDSVLAILTDEPNELVAPYHDRMLMR
jgi:putative SOS response-associated peptidase YedK